MSGTKLSGLPKIKLKIAIQVPKKHIYIQFRVLSTTTTASLAIKRKSRKKLEKVLIILKCISNRFYLLRANLHIYNLSIYLERYTEAVFQTLLLKTALCYRYVACFQRNTRVELLDGCSPFNSLNIRRRPFLKNTSG